MFVLDVFYAVYTLEWRKKILIVLIAGAIIFGSVIVFGCFTTCEIEESHTSLEMQTTTAPEKIKTTNSESLTSKTCVY